MKRPLFVEVAGQTDVGRKRSHNEDSFAILPEYGLLMVADGMGGHALGEIAAQMAVDTLHEFFAATANDPLRAWSYKRNRVRLYEQHRLKTGIKLCNHRIYEYGQRFCSERGTGTTLCALLAVEDGVCIAHVGDSRVYRVRDTGIEQLTEDHSLLNDYKKLKKLTEEEIDNFPEKHVIVRALGTDSEVQVDTRFEAARAGDVWLLCSDGLSDAVTDQRILEIVQSTTDLPTAASRLVDAANESGGPDNITCVIAR
ncbi:MAG TPA: Stp1/IreP family PP2C-type Ser/Thr phosphatase [Polyangiaceae bacterium]|nr:Stp1/IreP family PP2C-type Ser/Thr phosphatase [Polyangiaceae bacterium]